MKARDMQNKKLFSRDNNKTGKSLVFNLPALLTCPGKNEFCKLCCYATTRCYCFPVVISKYWYNYNKTKGQSFINEINQELLKSSIRLIRIHSSGDFYSVEYLRKWIEVVQTNLNKQFWTYTKTWKLRQFRSLLVKLNNLSNCVVWYSVDKYCQKLPKHNHIAYIQHSFDKHKVNCLAQLNHEITCNQCGMCFNKAAKKVVFKLHSKGTNLE